jgi:hypothetical protein
MLKKRDQQVINNNRQYKAISGELGGGGQKALLTKAEGRLVK